MKTLIVIGVAAALAGCVSNSQRNTALDTIVSRWRACVETSYSSFRSSGVERNLAAENAFMACRTEENAIGAFFASSADLYLTAVRIIAAKKAEAKSQLIASR